MARISAFRTIQLDGNELRSQSYAIAGLRRDFAQEQWKNCTPAPVDSYENQLLLSSCHDVTAWLTLDADRAVGMAIIQPTSRYAEGRYVLVYVLPEFRSLGIGRALFSAVAAELSCRNIETFGCSTLSCIPAGHTVMQRLAGKPVRAVRLTEARIASRTRFETIGLTQGHVKTRVFNGSYPTPRYAEQVAELAAAVSSQYRSNHPQSRDAALKQFLAQQDSVTRYGFERWTVMAFSSEGECLGFSEYLWDPKLPEVLVHHAMSVRDSLDRSTIVFALAAARREICEARPAIKKLRYVRSCPVSVSCAAAEATVRRPDHLDVGSVTHRYETRWSVRSESVCHYGRPKSFRGGAK